MSLESREETHFPVYSNSLFDSGVSIGLDWTLKNLFRKVRSLVVRLGNQEEAVVKGQRGLNLGRFYGFFF